MKIRVNDYVHVLADCRTDDFTDTVSAVKPGYITAAAGKTDSKGCSGYYHFLP